MAPKHHPTPLSGGDRKALNKELGKARAMTNILAAQSAEMRAKAQTMLQQADRLLCESWNERMWSDGEPIDPSPTIDQAINGGFPWLEIQCSRCKTPSDVDPAGMKHPPTTFVHDLASRLRCRKCERADARPQPCCSLPSNPATPGRRSKGCGQGRNHRPSILPTMDGHLRCRQQPRTSKPSIPNSGVRSSMAPQEEWPRHHCLSSPERVPARPTPSLIASPT
jgi:phage FluMu protein Com